MSGYQSERESIEAYFVNRWEGETPFGMDAQAFTPVANSVLLTINPGAVLQGSIGRTSNRLDCIGTLTVSIYTAGGAGSNTWRRYADLIIGFLRNVTLDDAGDPIFSHADAFLRFSPPQLAPNEHPYISANFADPPFHITNITAPFVRYDYT